MTSLKVLRLISMAALQSTYLLTITIVRRDQCTEKYLETILCTYNNILSGILTFLALLKVFDFNTSSRTLKSSAPSSTGPSDFKVISKESISEDSRKSMN